MPRIVARNMVIMLLTGGILLSAGLHAQDRERMQALEVQFRSGVSLIFQEKVFVDTDKTVYVPGETLWFKAYCVDAAFHTLSDLSKVLYVELLDAQGQAALQEKIHLRDGMGQGSFYLHGELLTGDYTLRAYTAWMRNSSPAFFYQQPLLIANPFLPPPQLTPEQVQDTALKIHFFPEGGQLVAGLPGRLAWQVQDPKSGGLAVSGLIRDTTGQVVAETQTTDEGLGDVWLHPEAGMRYELEITDTQGRSQFAYLPAVQPRGWNLHLQAGSNPDNWELRVRVQGLPDRRVYLLAHSRGIMRMVRSREIAEGEALFVIPRDSLLPGISHLTVFNENFQPVAERLSFRAPGPESQLRVSTDQASYSNRQKVQIAVSGAGKTPAQASLSVYRYAADAGPLSAHAVSSLLLDADLPAPIRSAAIDRVDTEAGSRHVDLLLLTAGWARFDWAEVLNETPTRIGYPIELNAPMLNGSLTFPENTPLPDKIHVSFPGEFAEIYTARIQESGRFFLEISPEIRGKQAVFWIDKGTLRANNLRLQSYFAPAPPMRSQAQSPSFLPLAYLQQNSINAQIANGYLPASHIRGREADITRQPTPFYGQPDVEYQLDAYTRFTTMEEVFSEYISAAVKRKNGLFIYDHYANANSISDNITFDEPALILIDGIEIQDPDFIWELDPLKVEKIHVVQRAYRSGEMLYPGLVNLITYAHDFGDSKLPEGIVRRLYQGLQQVRHFYAPDYRAGLPLDRVPDYRTVLLWEPDIQLAADETSQISCFTADDAGSYRIEINGITEAGEPIYGTAVFEVKSP